jgi:hypothetical protein
MQTKRENRGGARPGAGRKKSTLSQNQLNELLKKSRKYARQYGKTVEEVLLDLVYGESGDPDFGDKGRLAAIKLYMDKVYIDIKENGPADKALGGPAIYLPKKRPDPANEPIIKDDKEIKAG